MTRSKSLARIGFTYTRKSKSHYLVEEMVRNWWEQKNAYLLDDDRYSLGKALFYFYVHAD